MSSKTLSRVLGSAASLRYRLARAVSWTVLSVGGAQALLLVATVLMARRLGAEDFGRWGLIYATLNTVVAFITPSFGWALMRVAATLRDHNPHRMAQLSSAVLRIGAWTSFALAFGLAILAPWTSVYLFKDVGTQAALQITATAVFANGVLALQISLLMGLEAFRASAALHALRGVASAALMIGGVYWGGLVGTAWGFTLASFLCAGMGSVLLSRVLRERGISLHRTEIRRATQVLRDMSLPSFLSTVLSSVVMWLGNVLLVYAPNGLVQVALFSAANHWRTAILFLPTQINHSTAPILANLWGLGERARLRAVVRASLLANGLAAGLPALVAIAAAEPILSMYAFDSPSGIWSFRVLILSSVLTALCGLLGYAMVAMGQMWHGLAVNTVWAISFLAVAALMLETGAVGISVAYLVSYFLLLLISAAIVARDLSRSRQ
ncbi:MAG: oligosaccharide flippase family protein [Armatimonadota bacterium]|nr:oligosaccharide flippase family protein [Armatimonadota bacterium]